VKPPPAKSKLPASKFLVAAIRAQLAAGTAATRIMEDMELSEAEYHQLLEQMYTEDRVERLDKSPEKVYLDYCLRQEGVIRDLDKLIKKWTNGNQPQAVVGAARAKSEAIDRILQTGQQMGLIQKAPERHQIIAGIAVADMTDADLRSKISEQLEAVNAVMSRYGERDMLEVKPMTALPEPVRAVVSKTASTERTRSINPKTTGGLAKAKGAHAGATRHVVVRKKPATPPPDVSSLSSVSEPD